MKTSRLILAILTVAVVLLPACRLSPVRPADDEKILTTSETYRIVKLI